MYDARGVGGRHSIGHLRRNINELANGHGAASDKIAERFAAYEFACDVRSSIMFADIEDADDVGMVEGSGGAGFLLESGAAAWVRGECMRQNLERDLAVESGIEGAEDLAHAARAKGRDDPVGSDL